MPSLAIQVLPHAEGLELPAYQTPGSAGMDLRAAIDADEVLQPGARTAIPTGIRMALPAGHEGQVRPRSGLAFRHGLTDTNAPGTIDEDYRGEVKVLLVNLGSEPVTITAACMAQPGRTGRPGLRTDRGGLDGLTAAADSGRPACSRRRIRPAAERPQRRAVPWNNGRIRNADTVSRLRSQRAIADRVSSPSPIKGACRRMPRLRRPL